MHNAFHRLHAEASEAASLLAAQVAGGSLSPSEFGDEMAALLEDAHTRAVVIGRTHAGDTAPEEADDRLFAEAVVDGESEFLAAFVGDLEAGRYEGNAAGVERRSLAYLGRLAGSANEAWGLTLPPDTTLFWWRLQDHDAACAACPDLALNSPWRIDTIPTWPGQNQTPCLWQCRCEISTASGSRGFITPD